MYLQAFAEISDDGKRIEVHFPYSPEAVKAIKGDGTAQSGVPGRRFVPREKGGPYWTVPLDLETGKRLRQEFGEGLQLGDALKQWGLREKRRRRELRTLATANDADISRAYAALPRLERIIEGGKFQRSEMPEHLDWRHPYFRKREPRSYQRADISMMAQKSLLNGNAPGTGKTIEYVGAQAEAGRLEAAHVIFAPVTSHFDTWVTELLCLDVPGTILYGDNPDERYWAIEEAYKMTQAGEPVWLILGYNELRLAREREEDEDRPIVKRDHKGNAYVVQRSELQPLYENSWASVCVDESHKTGLPNPQSLFAMGAALLKAEARYSMSGTPMGGKPLRLWGHFHWLYPEEYGSKWRWAEHWLVIEEIDAGSKGMKKSIGGLLPGMEDQFYEAHAHHMVRREKRDALPGLPVKLVYDVMCPMTPKQRKQYKDFERDAEIMIEEQRLSAPNVLSEYRRLAQIANAVVRIEERGKKKVVIPTFDSGKWPKLLEKLDEHGIRAEDPEPRARAIVGSESIEMARVAAQFLESKGISTCQLHGDIKPKDRKVELAKFRSDAEEPIVLCMTIDTGGVSLNLEMADTVHALDEKWTPDDMEQFEERADRGAREKPLVVYYYRTEDSIQEYVHEVVMEKAVTNKNILDVRREIHKLEEAA